MNWNVGHKWRNDENSLFLFFVSILGSFQAINAEEVEEEVSGMWRTLFKLTKTFSDVPGPRRVADSTKSKIDKFKVYLPLLSCICNPGLRDRHWEQVCSVYLFICLSIKVASSKSECFLSWIPPPPFSRRVSGRAAYTVFVRWLKLSSVEFGQTVDGWPRRHDPATHLSVLRKGRQTSSPMPHLGMHSGPKLNDNVINKRLKYQVKRRC